MYEGVLNVYKERGFTSHDVVAKLRGILKMKRIGHTGTLDPDAEGVLPVCLGKATRLCDMLTDEGKVYRAVMLLGVETDTQDAGGHVLKSCAVAADSGPFVLSEDQITEAVRSFIGLYDQIPPMYSALKVDGKKLYELARRGIVVERKARQVSISRIDIESIELPRVSITVHCSKGTYIRTLCHDIGRPVWRVCCACAWDGSVWKTACALHRSKTYGTAAGWSVISYRSMKCSRDIRRLSPLRRLTRRLITATRWDLVWCALRTIPAGNCRLTSDRRKRLSRRTAGNTGFMTVRESFWESMYMSVRMDA